MAITGVAQPDDRTAKSNSLCARTGRSDGSAGADGVPTRRFKYMSQKTVCTPADRIDAGYAPSPVVATITPGRANCDCSWVAPKSIHNGFVSGRPQGPADARPGRASTAASATRTSTRRGTGVYR